MFFNQLEFITDPHLDLLLERWGLIGFFFLLLVCVSSFRLVSFIKLISLRSSFTSLSKTSLNALTAVKIASIVSSRSSILLRALSTWSSCYLAWLASYGGCVRPAMAFSTNTGDVVAFLLYFCLLLPTCYGLFVFSDISLSSTAVSVTATLYQSWLSAILLLWTSINGCTLS